MSEITKKITVVVLTLALAFTAVPGVVAGQTVAELQAQVTELQALIAELREQLAAPAAPAAPAVGALAACAEISFNRNLSLGARGADVKCLQALLNTDPATRVAATGVGSAGQETENFRSLTRAAVIAFQNKYATEVLAPVGLTAGTGFVGVHTRAKLNALLAAAPAEDPEEKPEEEEEKPAEPAVEGSLISRLLPTPTGVIVDHNASSVAVMGVEVEARDSAITIQRLDVNFNTARPWRRINHIAVFDGDRAVQGVAVTSANVTELSATDSRVRISGLNINVPRNTKKTLTIRVGTDARPVETGGVIITIPVNGIRGVDGLGISQTAPTAVHSMNFTVAAVAQGGRIEIRANTASPKEGIAITSTDVATEHEILRVDLIATRDNVQIRQLIFEHGDAVPASGTFRAIRLYDGTTLLGSVAYNAASSTFSNLALDINAGTTKTLSLRAEVSANFIGTIRSTLDRDPATNIIAISANDADVTFTGSAPGEIMRFFIVAPAISNVSANIVRSNATTVDATIRFRLTAQGGDVVIAQNTGTASGTFGVLMQAVGVGGLQMPRVTVGGDNLADEARTVPMGLSRDVVVEGRIVNLTPVRTSLIIQAIRWAGGSIVLPTELLRALATETFVVGQ